jgi:hypothetical protein
MATAAKKRKSPAAKPAKQPPRAGKDAASRQAAIARLVTQVAELQLQVAQVYEALLGLQQPGDGFSTGGISDRGNVKLQ